MRRFVCVGLVCILCMGVLSGCAEKTDVDTSTVFIEKKGQIVSVDVEALDKDYYDESELKEYISEHITEYTTDNGDTVEQISFNVTDKIAKLQMRYDTYEDYSGFNGIELYEGTVVKAQAAGYDFDTEFYKVPKKLTDTSEMEPASQDDVLADDNYKVAIIKSNVNVQVPGTILYVSKQNTKVLDKNTVSITGEEVGEEMALTYIIYK